jgi:hypothetical protein
MPTVVDQAEAPIAIQTHLACIFTSLELSRSIWLITSLSPGSGEKMSKHSVRAGDVAALLARFSELKRKAPGRTGKSFPIVVIQEAGLDGFWLHRVLQSEGIESHVVDPASIATSHRRRRAKTDRIDGEALLRALLAHKRGEPRVCAMVRAPTPEEEVLVRERDFVVADDHQPRIGDGCSTRVAGEIGEHALGSGERRLGVDDEGALAERAHTLGEGGGVGERAEPLHARRPLTLPAVAVPARVVSDADEPAIVAALDMAAERRRAAGRDRSDHAPLDAPQMSGVRSS